jgi:hypothetical protein
MIKKYVGWLKNNALLACSYIFVMAIIVVAIVAAAHVGYSLAEIQCAIEHAGHSASKSIVLFMLIPYGLVEVLLFAGSVITRILHGKKKKK